MAIRRPLLRRDRQAVSGVVAAALGVVLISILLSMVVTFWVPAWAYDNEVAHSREVIEALGQFKSSVESRAVQGATNQTVTTTFALGVGAVPLFGAETPGQLSFRYLEGNASRFEARLSDAGGLVNLTAAGGLRYEAANRYFVRQTFSYEGGALVLNQSDGAAARLPPAFTISNATEGVLVSATLVTLEGDGKTVTGVEPHTITSQVRVAHTQEHAWPTARNLTFEVHTWYPDAWFRFFNATAALALPAAMYSVTTAGTAAPYQVTLVLSGVTQLTATSALVTLVLN